MIRRALRTGIGLALILSPAALAAQGTGCRFLAPTENAARELEFGQPKVTIITPNILCDDGRQIQAEEMVTYESSGLSVFSGNVFFRDDQQTLRAFSANYYEREGRLEASGNVELIDLETGTELTGLSLVYLREGFQGRTEERIRVYGGQPRALLYPQATPPDPDSLPTPPLGETDSTVVVEGLAGDSIPEPLPDSLGADSIPVLQPDSVPAAPPVVDSVPREPYEVFGDEIEIRGSDYFRAVGSVQILRDSLDARADSLEYIQTESRLYLDGNAFVDQPAIDLSAREIMILLPGDVITDLVARGDGRLLGDRIDLAAPFIRVELDQGTLQGLWAAPLYREGQDSLELPLRTAVRDAEPDSADFDRPLAISDAVSMVGDSLDVRAPDQVLERVIAIGRARAVSSARDSLNTEDTPELIRNDWIEGDTVIAVFARRTGEDGTPLNPGDTVAASGSEFVLDRLEAAGASARSLYRLEPADDAEPGEMQPTPGDSTIVLGRTADADSADVAAGPDPAADSTALADPTVDPTAAGDSLAAGDPQAPGDGAAAAPDVPRRLLAIHYVVASRIVIRMENGQVRTMEVTGLQRGMHQEPIRTRSGGSGGGTNAGGATNGNGGGGER